MKRNLFIRIPIACILGIITTLAVAWGCASYCNPANATKNEGRVSYQDRDESDLDWYNGRFYVFEYAQPYLQRIVLFHDGPMPFDDWSGDDYPLRNLNIVPKWSRFLDPQGPDATHVDDARGWPFLAMRGGFDIDSPSGRGSIYKTYNAFILDFRPQLPGNDKTMTPMIPLAPIWRGFIYNSLIYAALWFLLLLLPQFIKARIRNARNQCRICGYDLRGTAHTHCPECGEEIKK